MQQARSWQKPLAWALTILGGLLVWLAINAHAGLESDVAARRLTQATFTLQRNDDTPSPGSRQARALVPPGPHAVLLPHTWAQDLQVRSGAGRYALDLMLDGPATQPWALRIDRLSSHHVIAVNGATVEDTMNAGGPGHKPFPTPSFVNLPAALLKPGHNRIDIEVQYAVRAGLSAVWSGPADDLRASFETKLLLNVRIPQALNMAAAGLSLFMVMLWWRRRHDKALGLFGALWTIVSLRNMGYYVVGTVSPGAFSDYAFYAVQVLSATLLGQFALAWSATNWRWYHRLLSGGSLFLLGTGLGAAAYGALMPWRYLSYPVLLAMSLPALWLVFTRAHRSNMAQIGLPIGLLIAFLAAAHDYLLIRGVTSVQDTFWLPYASPLTLLIVANALLDRFASTLEAGERHSVELEQRVDERTQALQAANAAHTRFLASASHDLRQPVVTISLLAGLLREQLKDSGSLPLLDRLTEAIKALDALLKGLLNLSRFEAGAVQVHWQVVPLNSLVERVLAHERAAAASKGLQLRCRMAPGLAVWSDPVLLEQILRNLISNAVRYTHHGGVLIGARRHGPHHLKLAVWDTGQGVPASQQDMIFEDFVQLDNPGRRASQGMGLGLALVRHAAALLHTPITLRSVEGQGSCFSTVVESATPVTEGERTPATPTTIWQDLKVVLVEDDPDVGDALALSLTTWGAQVSRHDDAHSALQALKMPRTAHPPDLLITDQRLGDGSGIDIVAAWRRHWAPRRVPALIITGDTAPQDVSTLARSGIPVLHKPFDGETLSSAVAALLPARQPEGSTH